MPDPIDYLDLDRREEAERLAVRREQEGQWAARPIWVWYCSDLACHTYRETEAGQGHPCYCQKCGAAFIPMTVYDELVRLRESHRHELAARVALEKRLAARDEEWAAQRGPCPECGKGG